MMTKYTQKSFSVPVGSKEYRKNWERIFKKKKNPDPYIKEAEGIYLAVLEYERGSMTR